MSLSQKVAYNTLVQIFAKAASVIFGLLTVRLLVGYLGRDLFGDYSYAVTLVVLFGAFADWGTQTIGVREASKEKKDQGRILGNIIFIRLILAVAATVLMILAAFWLPLKTTEPLVLRRIIILSSLLTFLFVVKSSLGIVFQTKLVMHRLAAADITASLLVFLFSCFLVLRQAGLIYFILAIIVANTIAVLIAFFLVRKTIALSYGPDWQFIKRFMKESLPMGLILIVFTIDNKIDTLMLGGIKGSSSVGIYGVAYRIYDVLILGAAYLMNALLPVIAGISQDKNWQDRLKKVYQKSFDVLMIMGLGVMFLVLVFSPVFVKVISGFRYPEFFDSVLVLRILSLSLFLAYFNHLVGYTIVALGKQRRYLLVSVLALIFNVVLNMMMIPRYSYFGAAWVTVLTEGLVLLISGFYIKCLINYFPLLTSFPKTGLEIIKKKAKIF